MYPIAVPEWMLGAQCAPDRVIYKVAQRAAVRRYNLIQYRSESEFVSVREHTYDILHTQTDNKYSPREKNIMEKEPVFIHSSAGLKKHLL